MYFIVVYKISPEAKSILLSTLKEAEELVENYRKQNKISFYCEMDYEAITHYAPRVKAHETPEYDFTRNYG